MAWLKKHDRGSSAVAATRELANHLREGGHLAPIAPPLVMQGGETAYTDIVVTAFAYYGADVSWASGYAVQCGPLFMAFGILRGELSQSRARREAERMAAAQWRAEGDIRLILTDKRLVLYFGSGIEVYWLEHLISVTPAPDGLSMVLAFNGGVPLAFGGQWVPWLCMMLSKLAHRTIWPPGHNPPAFLTEPPPKQKVVRGTPKSRPALAAASRPAEPSVAEQLADKVDRMPVAEAARELATHPAPLVTLVLDLLGTRKAAEIQSALTDLRR